MNDNIVTFSFDRNLPLMKSLQIFIDMWAKDEDYKERNNAINLIAELNHLSSDPTEYVATFKTSMQISHDDFEVYNPSLKVDSNTRVSAISDFYRKHNQSMSLEVKVDVYMASISFFVMMESGLSFRA